jgi:Mrp family chromosome partitioning ATPase
MGRMLEAFKLIDPQRPQTLETPPRQDWPRLEPVAPTLAPAEEEMPFIEVGGPRETLEASPEVLAARAKRTHEPAAEQGPRLRAVVPPTLADSPTRLMSVIFRPLPADSSPLCPVQYRFAPELIAFHRSEHPVSEQYRALAGGIAEQLPAGRSQVVLFTALTPEAGTTTVLLNIAITIARQGQLRVAVVDANLRRPALARRLDLPDAPGLHEFLDRTTTLAEVLQETGQPNLLVLTAGDGGATRTPGDSLRQVLRQLREQCDLVLVDGPCWDGRPEIVALGSACDGVYLVLPEEEASTPDTQAWVRTLPREGARLRGCIVTQR